MASLKSSNLGYHECRTEEQLLEFWRDRYLRSRDLEKEWSREIERLIAQDEGDEAMLARLDAEDRTKAEEAGRLMQEMLETIGKHYICPHCGKNTLDAPLSGQQTA